MKIGGGELTCHSRVMARQGFASAAGPWRIDAGPVQSNAQLGAVSCVSVTVCAAVGTIGNYSLGHIGSALSSATSRFATKYPRTFELANEVHDHRYGSLASHPLIKRSGKPTKKISYKFLPKAKRLLVSAAQELSAAGLL